MYKGRAQWPAFFNFFFGLLIDRGGNLLLLDMSGVVRVLCGGTD